METKSHRWLCDMCKREVNRLMQDAYYYKPPVEICIKCDKEYEQVKEFHHHQENK